MLSQIFQWLDGVFLTNVAVPSYDVELPCARIDMTDESFHGAFFCSYIVDCLQFGSLFLQVRQFLSVVDPVFYFQCSSGDTVDTDGVFDFLMEYYK